MIVITQIPETRIVVLLNAVDPVTDCIKLLRCSFTESIPPGSGNFAELPDQKQAGTIRQPRGIEPAHRGRQRQALLFSAGQIQQPDAIGPFPIGLERQSCSVGREDLMTITTAMIGQDPGAGIIQTQQICPVAGDLPGQSAVGRTIGAPRPVTTQQVAVSGIDVNQNQRPNPFAVCRGNDGAVIQPGDSIHASRRHGHFSRIVPRDNIQHQQPAIGGPPAEKSDAPAIR